MDIVAYILLFMVLVWFYSKLFVNKTVLAGFISGMASLFTIAILVNANWLFGIKGMLGVVALLGAIYYLVVMRRKDYSSATD